MLEAVIHRMNEEMSGTLTQWLRYDEAITTMRKIAGEEVANNVIKIIEEESNSIDRRTAFLWTTTTIEEMMAGADYSNVKSIQDISEVYAGSLLKRLGFTDERSISDVDIANQEKVVRFDKRWN